MKMKILSVLIAGVVWCCLCSLSSGQTLWEKRDTEKAFLFNDFKARKVGDLLTIIVNERTDVANSDSRELRKQTATDAGTQFSYGGSNASGSFDANIDSESTRDFNGDVTFSSDREFSDRFSVVVIDVLPNGNLLVAGKRSLIVEGDRKQLTLSGIIRKHDIRADNSVFSQQVAEMNIQFEGQGVESKFVNQGWLARRLNRLWPF